jgi:stage III sporulation protein AE
VLKRLLLSRIGVLLLLVLLFSGIPFLPAAAEEEARTQVLKPGENAGEEISSLEGWEQVEKYWRELEAEVGEFLPSWNIRDIWKKDEGGIVPGVGEILRGLCRYLFMEIVANLGLLGQLILLAVAAALLKSLQGAFGSEEVARITEAVAFFVLLGLALKSFTVALDIGRSAVDSMVNFMMALLPVLFTLLASLGHITSATLFHPFIIFSVNIMASLVRNVLFPLIFFATILYLVNHFSPHFKINRLADLFRDISIWALGLMLTLFVGLTALQGVAGGIGDALSLRTAKFMTGVFIPVVGKMLADAVETVLGYSLLLKNSATVAGLAMLSLMIAFPLLKLLSLIIIYKFSGALIQPLGETTLGEALHTMSNCLIMVFAAVATVALAFFIGIAIIVGASNATIMLR